jgi:hypothetical protein
MSNLVYDGPGGLFTRLGALIFMMDAVRTHQNNLKTLLANVQLEYSSADSYMIERLAGSIDGRINEAGNVLLDVQAAAERTLIEMCYASATASGSALTMKSKTATDALTWLIRAMDSETTPETVDGTTLTKSTITLGASNVGTGRFAYNFLCPKVLMGSTAEWPNVRSELLEARCVQDATNGTLTTGSEIFEVRGQAAYSPLDYRFPGGSGAFMRLASVTAGIDAGPRFQNQLTNSDFEDFTSNVPNLWTVSSGTAGTEFAQTTTAADVFRGSSAFRMRVTGSTFKIRQQFGIATGTIAKINPDRPYLLGCAIKKDAGATGTIRISVQDASGTIIGTANDFSLQLILASAATTSYAIVFNPLRSPRNVPNETYLVLESTTAVAVADAYIDEIVLAEMMPIAPGGQALSLIAGATDWRIDDFAQYTFTNNDEGAFVRAFDRLFNMYSHGLALPQKTDGTETISDTLIA